MSGADGRHFERAADLMNGLALRDAMRAIRGAPPRCVCTRCGTLRDADERCDLHPEDEPVDLHSHVWSQLVTRPAPTTLGALGRRALSGLAALSLAGLVLSVYLARQAAVHGSWDPQFTLSLAALIPITSLLGLLGWGIPRLRRHTHDIRRNRPSIGKLALLALAPLVVSAGLVAFDLVQLLGHVRISYGPHWYVYAASTPLFVLTASIGWRRSDLRGWAPRERDAPEPTEAREPRVGTLVGSPGVALAYFVRGLPADRLTPMDGWARELRIELDGDAGVVRVPAGPIRLLDPDSGAERVGDDVMDATIAWWWAGWGGPPAFHLTGATVHLLGAGDRVAIHGALEGDIQPGETYRGTGEVAYVARSPVYLKRVGPRS